jgi:hypothetical protein
MWVGIVFFWGGLALVWLLSGRLLAGNVRDWGCAAPRGGGGVVYAREMVSLFWGCGEGGFGVRFVGVGVNFLWC